MAVINLEAIRALAAAATPGPWQWFGNTNTSEVYLATVDRGRLLVMDFVRWGMSGAQPRFQTTLGGLGGGGIMQSLRNLVDAASPLGPIYEATYRKQFTGIGHPDARFMAAARTAVPELIAEVERLRVLNGDWAQLATAHLGEADRARAALVEACDRLESWVPHYATADKRIAGSADIAAIRKRGGV